MRTPLIALIGVAVGGSAWANGKATKTPPPRVIEMSVTDQGYQPAKLSVTRGQPLKLVVTRKTDATCATDLLIEGTDIKVALPLNKSVEVSWTPTKSGQVKYGCAMGMMISGLLLVE